MMAGLKYPIAIGTRALEDSSSDIGRWGPKFLRVSTTLLSRVAISRGVHFLLMRRIRRSPNATRKSAAPAMTPQAANMANVQPSESVIGARCCWDRAEPLAVNMAAKNNPGIATSTEDQTATRVPAFVRGKKRSRVQVRIVKTRPATT